VDVWAIGCIFSEILTGQPLFAAETDIDQLYKIMRYCGPLTSRYIECFQKNPHYGGIRVPEIGKQVPLENRCGGMSRTAIDWLKVKLISLALVCF
jgi:cyclin-dependent kinase-like